jgi:RNA polymerase-binding transcription factor DksA
MNTVSALNPWARLIKRRNEITVTLRHVESEQKNVEAKAATMDRDARASRLDLLRYLNDWYSREITQVNQALERLDRNDYGVCVVCHGAIAAERLEISPETEFCSACEAFQEHASAASDRMLGNSTKRI